MRADDAQEQQTVGALHRNHAERTPEPGPDPIRIRPYRRADAAATLAVFLAAVSETAAAHYTPEQLAAWARPQERTVADWHASMLARQSVVAVVDQAVAGFSDVRHDGYVDMLFVAPSCARRGIATALLSYAEQRAIEAGARSLTASVSLTARPVFERAGFVVLGERRPVIAGVALMNFRMAKTLDVGP